jgi:hypothetical protein
MNNELAKEDLLLYIYLLTDFFLTVSILFGSIFAIRLFDLKGVQYFSKVS